MREKILLIDDNPEEKFGDRILVDILSDLFSDTYELVVEKDPDAGVMLPTKDEAIKLVLLDIVFGDIPYGKEVAKVLNNYDDDLKVVVLTIQDGRGEKITFGQMGNVWYYHLKEDLARVDGQMQLRNIISALIEDPHNTKWSITLDDNEQIARLHHPSYPEFANKKPITLDSLDQFLVLERCLETPNECFNITDLELSDGFILPKVVAALNAKLLEHTNYRTWGFIDSKRCAKNMVKVVIGEEQMLERAEPPGAMDLIKQLSEEVERLKERISRLENR